MQTYSPNNRSVKKLLRLFGMCCLVCSEQQVEKLIERSLAVMKNAYCPYSDFPVGAALVTHDGTIFAGTS